MAFSALALGSLTTNALGMAAFGADFSALASPFTDLALELFVFITLELFPSGTVYV